MFMQISFLLIYKKYFLLTIHLHQQKISEKTLKSILFILPHFHQKINCCLLWKILLPLLFIPEKNILLSFLLYLSLFTKYLKAPFYKVLKEKIEHKKGEKRRGGLPCIYMKKMRKILLCMLHKEAENAHSIRLWRKKENIKIMKKGRGG